MIRFIAAAVLTAAIVAPLSCLADGNAGIVYGRVLLSTTHQPICPITVRVISNREGPWETHTQPNGSFIFLQVRPGPVEIIIGRNREVRRVNVSANLEEQQTFYLKPVRVSYVSAGGFASTAVRLCPSSTYRDYVFTDYDFNGSWIR